MTDTAGFQDDGREKRRYDYDSLIRTYAKQLFNFGIRFCQDEEVVKDCIQQLFLDLWNRNFDIDEDNKIKSYLFKAIRNRVLREKSKWSRDETLDENYDFIMEFDVETHLLIDDSHREVTLRLQQLLNNLPPRQREIIYLKFYEDLDPAQISAIMNLHRQSVHNLLQKAYGNLRIDWKVLTIFLGILSIRDL